MWQPRKRRWSAIVAVGLGLALLAAGLVVLLVPQLRDQVLGKSTASVPKVEVPDVTTGNPLFAQAQQRLLATGFKVSRVDVPGNGVEPDRVLKQSPPAGSLLAKGRTVTLSVANSQVTLPNVVGQNAIQAATALQQLGLQVNPVNQPTDASTAVPGTVLAMNPAAATVVNRGSTVTLTVAQQPQVSVPAVQGQDQVAASNAIQQAGLQPQIVPQSNPGVAAGKVITTNPPGGTMVAKGSTVQLFVSTGPQTVVVPGVVGQTRDAAIGALTGAGLGVQATCSSGSSVVASQNPAAGTQAQPGSTVAIACLP
jgi:serine/threonine-protein kinase